MNKLNTSMDVPSGFIIMDKQVGPTSHNIVDRLRHITGIKKIGHAGTLDPFASGVLLMAIGRKATREISDYVKLDKRYKADLLLGSVSTTHDPEGEIIVMQNIQEIKLEDIKKVIKKFVGEQEQIPPMFSAKKIGGKKLYQLARAGKVVERQPSIVNIKKINILKYKWPKLVLDISCSSGTYIRTLGSDIGKELGVGAYLTDLRRTAIGKFLIDDAVLLEELDSDEWEKKLFLRL
jgi:tRNA pseudouridine55 synthase